MTTCTNYDRNVRNYDNRRHDCGWQVFACWHSPEGYCLHTPVWGRAYRKENPSRLREYEQVDMVVDRLAKIEQRLDSVSATVELQERLGRLAIRQKRLARIADTVWSGIVSALRDVSAAVEDISETAESANSDIRSYDLTEDE